MYLVPYFDLNPFDQPCYDQVLGADYSKYDVMEGTQVYRAKYREEQLPKDLEAAYELGKRLVEKAKEAQA